MSRGKGRCLMCSYQPHVPGDELCVSCRDALSKRIAVETVVAKARELDGLEKRFRQGRRNSTYERPAHRSSEQGRYRVAKRRGSA